MRPAAAAPRIHERVAVIDLGPGSTTAQQQLAAAVVAAGLDPVSGGSPATSVSAAPSGSGDGVEEALAGRDVERDAVQLAAALATAQRAFGALACGEVTAAAQQAIGIAAARQAAGRPVPELPRAWTYLLLCADRDNQLDVALRAAHQLRALGGSPDVPAAVWAKYPDVDAIANRELVELDVDAGVAGAAIWIDFQQVGVSPAHVVLAAGEHVLAAASGDRRGWAAGTAIAAQRSVHVPLSDVAGPWAELARRVASWNGKRPAASELAWVLARVHARIALVRHGDQIEAWGQIGRSEAPQRIDGAQIGEVERVLGLVIDRVHTWNDHAPDPDQPLLVEQAGERRARNDVGDKPTRWWVYAAIAGAATIGAGLIYLHDSASDRQRVELRYP